MGRRKKEVTSEIKNEMFENPYTISAKEEDLDKILLNYVARHKGCYFVDGKQISIIEILGKKEVIETEVEEAETESEA